MKNHDMIYTYQSLIAWVGRAQIYHSKDEWQEIIDWWKIQNPTFENDEPSEKKVFEAAVALLEALRDDA